MNESLRLSELIDVTQGDVERALSEQAKQETAPTQVVNVHIYGNVVDHDEFAREIIPSITKAMEDGVK